MAKSPEFISPEQRRRSQEFDAIIWDIEHAIHALARARNFPRRELESFHQVKSMLFLPDVRHGVLEIPREHRITDSIPLIVAGRHEQQTFGASFFHQTPRQMDKSMRVWQDMGLGKTNTRKYVETLKESTLQGSQTDIQLRTFDYGVGAHVQTPVSMHRLKNGATAYRTLRPIVRIPSDNDESINAAAMYHEAIHIFQAMNDPVFYEYNQEDRLLSHEFHAYDKGHKINNALVDSGNYYRTPQMLSLQRTTAAVVDVIDRVNAGKANRYAASVTGRIAMNMAGIRV